MLGVDPKRTAVPAQVADYTISFRSESSRNGFTKSRPPVQVVEEILEEIDMELESDIEEVKGSVRHHNHQDREDEEGRYGIGAREQPPTKRRRTGTIQDTHTVFTTDDDNDDELIATDEEDSLEEYESGGAEESPNPKTVRQDKRRAYWLSKGIGNGAVDGYSS
jgi:non-canonical poly(A) RNA polymerase PAPD5/7